MILTLVFPNPNRKKSYQSIMRKYHVFINGVSVFQVDQDSVLNGDITCKEGDKIFVKKLFAWNSLDASFYYKVGEKTAELINQQKEKKYVTVDIKDNVLFILDDIDFKKAIHICNR